MENQISEFFNLINSAPMWTVVIFIFFSACIQQVFPPYPSDTLVLIIGVLAGQAASGWYFLIITFFLGTIFSSIMLYEIGYKYGEKVLSFKLVKKLVDDKSIEKAKKFAQKAEGFAFVISRFAPGMFTVMLIIGGLIQLKRKSSWLFICLASLIGCAIYFFAGLFVGKNMEMLIMFAKSMGILGIVIIVAFVVFGMLIYKFNKVKQENN